MMIGTRRFAVDLALGKFTCLGSAKGLRIDAVVQSLRDCRLWLIAPGAMTGLVRPGRKPVVDCSRRLLRAVTRARQRMSAPNPIERFAGSAS